MVPRVERWSSALMSLHGPHHGVSLLGARALLFASAPAKGQPYTERQQSRRVGSVTSFTLPEPHHRDIPSIAGGSRYGFLLPYATSTGFIGPHSVTWGVARVPRLWFQWHALAWLRKAAERGQMLNSIYYAPRGHGRCSRTSGSAGAFAWRSRFPSSIGGRLGSSNQSLGGDSGPLAQSVLLYCQPILMASALPVNGTYRRKHWRARLPTLRLHRASLVSRSQPWPLRRSVF